MSSVGRLYDEIPLKLEFIRQTAREKEELAASVSWPSWDQERQSLFPTPGTIVMDDAIRYMRGRYERLAAYPDQRDTLHAVKLLTSIGILPLSHDRVQLVLGTVFNRHVDHLPDILEELSANAFVLQPGGQDPVVPEQAYLRDSVVPLDARYSTERVFPQLVPALEHVHDSDGLAMIGLTCALSLQRDDLAVFAYDAALRVEPLHKSALNNRTSSLNRLSRHLEAMETIEKLLAFDSDFVPAIVNRGVALAASGRMGEALQAYELALKHDRYNRVALSNKGAALCDLGRQAEALEPLNTAICLYPNFADAYLQRGKAHTALNERLNALEDLDRAVELDATNVNGHFHRGMALGHLGRHDQAILEFDEALRLSPESFKIHYNRGVALGNMARHSEALNEFQEFYANDFRDLLNLRARGIALNYLERFDEAIKALGECLDAWPQDPECLFHRAVSHYWAGNLDDALQDVTQVLEVQPAREDARTLSVAIEERTHSE